MAPVGEWVPDAPGPLRANDHNATRSNRYDPISGPAGDVTVGYTISATEFRSARLNPDRRPAEWATLDAPTAVRERTYAYLAGDGPIVGETVVVSVPSVQFPGVGNPAARLTPSDVLPTASSFEERDGDGPGAAVAEVLAPTGVREVTELAPAINRATPVLYDTLTRATSVDSEPFVAQWGEERRSSDGAAVASAPALARAVATLDGGVELPVVLYAHRVRHAGDYLFVVGWVVDAGALCADAVTLLVDGGPAEVVGLETSALSGAPSTEVLGELPSRGRMGSLVFDGAAGEDLLAFLPERFRAGPDARRFAAVARAARGAGRDRKLGVELALPAFDGDADDRPPLSTTVVNLDATLVHLTAACPDCPFEDSWVTGARV
jgi:hypothetical protein